MSKQIKTERDTRRFIAKCVKAYEEDNTISQDQLERLFSVNWTTLYKVFDVESWRELRVKLHKMSNLPDMSEERIHTNARKRKRVTLDELEDLILDEFEDNGFIVVSDFCSRYDCSRNKFIHYTYELKSKGYRINKFKAKGNELAYGLFEMKKEVYKLKERNFKVRQNHDGLPYYHFLFKEDHVKILPVGDCHIQSEREVLMVREILNKCRDENFYVIITGDMFEMATRYSIGSGVYHQKYNNHEQFEVIKEIMEDYQDIILFVTDGNHENRAIKEIGVSLMKIICDQLKIPYAYGRLHAIIETNLNEREIFCIHKTGSSAQTMDGKRKAIYKRPAEVYSDIDYYVCGHLHEGLAETQKFKLKTDRNSLSPEVHRFFAIMNPSLLPFFGGYGDVSGYNPPNNLEWFYIDINRFDYGVGKFDYELPLE